MKEFGFMDMAFSNFLYFPDLSVWFFCEKIHLLVSFFRHCRIHGYDFQKNFRIYRYTFQKCLRIHERYFCDVNGTALYLGNSSEILGCEV